MRKNGKIVDAKPFLKWAGGKRRLLKQYNPFFPKRNTIHRYFEPFIGSAAVYFHLQPEKAHLSDINRNLVIIYRVVQESVDDLIRILTNHRNEEAYYYRIRAQDPAELSPTEQAARLIYMNKTCYNGLYRENSTGRFNVPFGRYKNPKICDEKRLRRASRALQGVKLEVMDFEEATKTAREGDFIYFDPPYAPISDTSNFTSYNQSGFNEHDQRRLATVIQQLTARGCKVMLSNSNAPVIYDLYAIDGYHLIEVQSRRSINSKATGRGPVTELLILNYEPGG